MPISKRREDASPRQEWFEDKSGPFIMEISFSGTHGYQIRELISLDERATRGQNTPIVVTGLSRERMSELRRKIDDVIRGNRESQQPEIMAEVTRLTAQVHDIVSQWALNVEDDTGIEKTGDVLGGVGRFLKDRQQRTYQRDRSLILGVLMEDDGLEMAA